MSSRVTSEPLRSRIAPALETRPRCGLSRGDSRRQHRLKIDGVRVEGDLLGTVAVLLRLNCQRVFAVTQPQVRGERIAAVFIDLLVEDQLTAAIGGLDPCTA